MGNFANLEAVRDAVVANGDVLTVLMGDLRDAYGSGKLGVHVRAGISKGLKGVGLGHFPEELPEYQDRAVRLFRMGTPIADLIDAVLTPGAQHDEELRSAAGGGDAELLRRVRELICADVR